jgi:hypothetical protein
MEVLNSADAWYPAIDSGRGIHDGAPGVSVKNPVMR